MDFIPDLDLGTEVKIIGTATGHGFDIGTTVGLVRYDEDGSMRFSGVGSSGNTESWWVGVTDFAVPGLEARTVKITAEQEQNLLSAAQDAEDQAGLDSNDAEIEKLREAYEAAFSVLGIKIPEDFKEDS